MNELMLTVYPRQPRTPGPGTGWADWRRDQDRECRMAHDKRFSDAELAAAHWGAAYMVQTRFHSIHADENTHWMEWDKQCETLHRFATHPHYYEEQE